MEIVENKLEGYRKEHRQKTTSMFVMKQTEQKDGGFIDRVLQAWVSSMLFRDTFSGAN